MENSAKLDSKQKICDGEEQESTSVINRCETTLTPSSEEKDMNNSEKEQGSSYKENLKDNKCDGEEQESTSVINSETTLTPSSEEKDMNNSEKEQGSSYKENLKDNKLSNLEIYKKKLDETISALQQKEEELKSFKDRIAGHLAVSIKTGGTESMNSPVNQSRLTEMYQKLRLVQWPNIKDHLKSKEIKPMDTKALIKKMFKHASEEMEKKKTQIDEVFGLTGSRKVNQYAQLSIQNLQLSMYHSSKEDLLRTLALDPECQYFQDVKANLIPLASECYWLGCLMALNNPPLQPDWKNHIPVMNPWDVFPQNINELCHVEEASSAKKKNSNCVI